MSFTVMMETGEGRNNNPDWPTETGRQARSDIGWRDNGGRGQNRTADTGIFKASKINNLLIILEQGMLGTVRNYCVDSTG